MPWNLWRHYYICNYSNGSIAYIKILSGRTEIRTLSGCCNILNPDLGYVERKKVRIIIHTGEIKAKTIFGNKKIDFEKMISNCHMKYESDNDYLFCPPYWDLVFLS